MEKLKNSLIEKGYGFEAFESIEELNKFLLKDIGPNESIGFGGSVTIKEAGIYESFKSRGNKLYWHWTKDCDDPLKKASQADIYMTSSNAITEDGKLINIDGTGNRVSSMIYGHKRVYIIVGKNKISKDYQEGLDRARNIAGPKNAKRLRVNTPCVKLGKCIDCKSKDRICRVEICFHEKPSSQPIIICLVNENLGY